MDRACDRHAHGRLGEDLAVEHLRQLGYSILGRNLRVGHLEIDVLAQLEDVVIVAEVRTRGHGSWLRALDTLAFEKRRRVRIAGEALWRARFARRRDVQRMRFDLIAIDLSTTPRRLTHVRAAF